MSATAFLTFYCICILTEVYKYTEIIFSPDYYLIVNRIGNYSDIMNCNAWMAVHFVLKKWLDLE